MTIAEALAYGRSQLIHSYSPQLDARLLLGYLLERDHSYLIVHGEEALTTEQAEQYQLLVKRAAQKEPIPYIMGSAPFFDFEVAVSPAVLIPRPETELLVETAVNWAQTRPAARLVDVGTGSGAIAIALARQLPQAGIEAVEISKEALRIARDNADKLAPDRIHFYEGNLLAPISGQVTGIVANLPYVTDGEWTAIDDGVKWYEPALALRGGADGLDLIRRLLVQAITTLAPGGALFLEIGWQQGMTAAQVAQSLLPAATVELLPDYAGRDRIVVIQTT